MQLSSLLGAALPQNVAFVVGRPQAELDFLPADQIKRLAIWMLSASFCAYSSHVLFERLNDIDTMIVCVAGLVSGRSRQLVQRPRRLIRVRRRARCCASLPVVIAVSECETTREDATSWSPGL